MKYLELFIGIVFDKYFTFNKLVDYIAERSLNSINSLYKAAKVHWGLSKGAL